LVPAWLANFLAKSGTGFQLKVESYSTTLPDRRAAPQQGKQQMQQDLNRPAIAVIGAGTIGHTHAEVIVRTPEARLAAIVEPGAAGPALANRLGVPHFPDHHALLAAQRPALAIIGTPNQTHLPIARDFLRAGIPVLVEKPIASTVEEGEAIAAEAAAAGVPAMTGHHRRHNPIIRAARAAVREGRLGRLTAGTVIATFLKPDSYFEAAWRRAPGGGPVLINLIHEIDLIRFIAGEIVAVQAVTSNARRGFVVEDTAAVILEMECGALLTVTLSDTVAAPWSWDLSLVENPATFKAPPTRVETHFFCGTEASISLPGLVRWHYGEARGWHEPLFHERLDVTPADPYEEQLRHMLLVLKGEEAPICSAADGARTLAATLAVQEAARTRAVVRLK
jgi:predicted dehydrogenase